MFKLDIETVENKEKIEKFKREILKGLSLEKFTDSEDMLFNDTIEACIDSAISSAESYNYGFKVLDNINNEGDWGDIEGISNFINLILEKYQIPEDTFNNLRNCFYYLVKDVEKTCFMEFNNNVELPFYEKETLEKRIKKIEVHIDGKDEVLDAEEKEELENKIKLLENKIKEIEKNFWDNDIEIDFPDFFIFNLNYHSLI